MNLKYNNNNMNIFIDKVFKKYYQKYPINLVDIGVSGGLKDNWKSAKEYLNVIGFEPDPREFEILCKNKTGSIKYFNTALYKEKSNIKFYLTRKQETSSILKPNREFLDNFPESERFDILDEIQIETDTLDNQLESNNINDIDFIKLDTEGSEYFIIEGSQNIIQNSVFGMEIEAGFAQIRHGQPLFSDIDKVMKKLGFHLFDTMPYYWKRKSGKNLGNLKGQIIIGDFLYFRTIESFQKILNKYEDDFLKKSKILRAISICELYGYIDYAKNIFDENIKLFDVTEKQIFEKKIQLLSLRKNILDRLPFSIRSKKCISNFCYAMSIIFYKLYKLFKTKENVWAYCEDKLGNNNTL